MNSKALIGKEMVDSQLKKYCIIEVEDDPDIKEVVIKFKNKKMFNLYYALSTHYLKFVDKDLNKEINALVRKELKKEKERMFYFE